MNFAAATGNPGTLVNGDAQVGGIPAQIYQSFGTQNILVPGQGIWISVYHGPEDDSGVGQEEINAIVPSIQFGEALSET